MPRRYIWFDHQSNIIIGLMMKFRSLVLQTIIPWLCWAWTLHEPPRYWSGTTSPQPLLSARESRTGHVDVDIRMVNDGSIRRRLFWGLICRWWRGQVAGRFRCLFVFFTAVISSREAKRGAHSCTCVWGPQRQCCAHLMSFCHVIRLGWWYDNGVRFWWWQPYVITRNFPG